MSRRYIIAPSAVADLDEIWLYFAQKTNIEIAERAFWTPSPGFFHCLLQVPTWGDIAPILARRCVAFRLPTTEFTIGKIAGAEFAFCTSSTPLVTRTSYSNSR